MARVDHDVEAAAQLVQACFGLVGGLTHQCPGKALVLNAEADLVIRVGRATGTPR